MASERGSHEEQRPPLPPRPSTNASSMTAGVPAPATTAITPLDVQTLQFPDGSRGTFSAQDDNPLSSPPSRGQSTPVKDQSNDSIDLDDTASAVSLAPTGRLAGDIASLLAGELNKKSAAWNLLRSQSSTVPPFDPSRVETPDSLAQYGQEFETLPLEEEGYSDEDRLARWKAKLKHYMIISSAGKPIWSRHGDLALINSSIGVIHTIISFYEGAKNPLQSFTAGNAKFVVLTQGPLYFVAITRLGESESQIRAQLEALYMQILSTLTLPTLTKIFVNRPSSDLSKPLEGTESLLSSLADNFTKGSPSAMLGSLECLKLRKSHRHVINNTFLKARSDKLLYGLIVAGGRLVSVIRPRQHSLHPSDLQLIFNMLFESGGIKAGGGENWIPLCLPAFNNKGYLYMYVSFFDAMAATEHPMPTQSERGSTEQEVALILVSADRESFFELQQMRNNVVKQLTKNGSLARIQTSVQAGRPSVVDVAPGSQVSHFLYKSRANVQFCMSTLSPIFDHGVERRRLMNVYHELHASVHAKNAHLKVLHSTSSEASALAWVTPTFEFYCIGGPNLSRSAMTQGANKIIQWTRKEEERLFIIGGGVF